MANYEDVLCYLHYLKSGEPMRNSPWNAEQIRAFRNVTDNLRTDILTNLDNNSSAFDDNGRTFFAINGDWYPSTYPGKFSSEVAKNGLAKEAKTHCIWIILDSLLRDRAVGLMYRNSGAMLQFKSKHTSDFYDISTPENFAQTCISLLQRQYEAGFFDIATNYANINFSIGKNDSSYFLYEYLKDKTNIEQKYGEDFDDLHKRWSAHFDLTPYRVENHGKMIWDVKRMHKEIMMTGFINVCGELNQTMFLHALMQDIDDISDYYDSIVHYIKTNIPEDTLFGEWLHHHYRNLQTDQQRAIDVLTQAADNVSDTAILRAVGRKAFKLLDERNGNTYESFDIVPLEKPVLNLEKYRTPIWDAEAKPTSPTL